MKGNGRFLFVMGLAVAMSLTSARGQEEKETLGDKIKRLFHHPTPTPTPRRSHPRISPYPNAASTGTPTFSEEGTTPISSGTATPSTDSSASFDTSSPAATKAPETQYFEPVRPINPGPDGRSVPRMIHAPQTLMTPGPAETATPLSEVAPEETPGLRPMPSLPQTISTPGAQADSSPENASDANSESPMPSVTSTPAVAQTARTPLSSSKQTPSSAISIDQLADASQYSSDLRRLIEVGLGLTNKNLGYKYASADPSKGGMDCSGFIFYVFTNAGIENVPRDAREQYAWVRKAGNFQAVLGHSDDTYELDGLRPGDLLFWANVSGVSHEPEITQITIYIGRDRSTHDRLMMGASENSTYKGEKKSGVGVFDFKLARAGSDADEEASSVFVGYGRFPDLRP